MGAPGERARSVPLQGGVFPFRTTTERPIRMFAGEGGPEQTNRRFHYLSGEMPAVRLSTTFDSVTLYCENPDERPDIYGKVGNSGVSLVSLDDAKRLYSGFDLLDPSTSVSMTINGPAPMILAFFLNAAIDQQCEMEFDRISERGGVLGAMETQYLRSKIQEESLHYERLKSSGALPIIGVNTFLSDDGSPFVRPKEIIRSAAEERDRLVAEMDQFHHRNEKQAAELLDELQRVALSGGNTFDALMAAAKVCSLGQMTHALYAVGGQCRRNM